MTARAGPVSYILLAEFDIDQGSILKHSYPAATGTDEQYVQGEGVTEQNKANGGWCHLQSFGGAYAA